MAGPDHKASLEPQELRQMVAGIRKIELALGNGEKQVSESERANVDIARKVSWQLWTFEKVRNFQRRT